MSNMSELAHDIEQISREMLEVQRLIRRNNELLAALGDCYDYFDQRADAQYFTDSPSPIPNEEMTILSRIKGCLDHE